MAKWNGGISQQGGGRLRLGLALSSMFHDHHTILLDPSRGIREGSSRPGGSDWPPASAEDSPTRDLRLRI